MAPVVVPGISGQVLNGIPDQWSAAWFRNFCLLHLQHADARNAVAGANVTISGGIGSPATISAGAALIANDTVLGNVSGVPAGAVGLTTAQLTALVNEATAGASGAVPAMPNSTTEWLRGDMTWQTLPAYPSSANPSASIGLAAVDGSAATFMTSDSAPALSQAIAPTWTGKHTFNPTSAIGITVNASAAAGILVNGYANAYAIQISASSTSGESFGLLIEAGTTAADVAFAIEPVAGGAVFLEIFGDGHGTLGSTSAAGIQWDSSGNVTVQNLTTVTTAVLDTGVKVASTAAHTMAFYGVTPVAQRATTSNQQSSKVSSVTGTISVSTGAINQIVLSLQEVMKTLNAYGLWGTI